MNKLKINISDFQEIITMVIQKYITLNGDSIETEQDYFGFIGMDEAIDLSKDSVPMCVGSLEDDYDNLNEILQNKREIDILDLERISNIFKIISYEIEHQNEKML